MQFAAGQAAFAEALLDPARAAPDGVTTTRGEADPTRFAVYRNNVFVGLTAALAKRFPVVERLVGKGFFAGMARVFAGLHKPASPLLFEYGDAFPEFIEQFQPAQGLIYLADVARLEAAWTRAYHAEDAEPLSTGQLAALAPQNLGQTRLLPHSAAVLVASRHPVGSIWAAHQGEGIGGVCSWKPETVLVARPAMDVAFHVLPSGDASFARALFAGETLAQAAERALSTSPDFNFGTAVVGLVSLGAFRAADQQDNPT